MKDEKEPAVGALGESPPGRGGRGAKALRQE